MFKDRDLFILGFGTLLAVFCLMLPFAFIGKVFLGVFVLILFMGTALMRFGPDRIPLEEWLKRRIVHRLRARKYTYQQPGYVSPPVAHLWPPQDTSKSSSVQLSSSPGLNPIAFSFDGNNVYYFAGAWLVVVGVYFVSWLFEGGTGVIAQDLEIFLRGVLR